MQIPFAHFLSKVSDLKSLQGLAIYWSKSTNKNDLYLLFSTCCTISSVNFAPFYIYFLTKCRHIRAHLSNKNWFEYYSVHEKLVKSKSDHYAIIFNHSTDAKCQKNLILHSIVYLPKYYKSYMEHFNISTLMLHFFSIIHKSQHKTN